MFEKIKTISKRKKTKFKAKLSGHPYKLGAFVPTGLPWVVPKNQPWQPWLLHNEIQYHISITGSP